MEMVHSCCSTNSLKLFTHVAFGSHAPRGDIPGAQSLCYKLQFKFLAFGHMIGIEGSAISRGGPQRTNNIR